jgi:hypothetical protein
MATLTLGAYIIPKGRKIVQAVMVMHIIITPWVLSQVKSIDVGFKYLIFTTERGGVGVVGTGLGQ